MQLNLDLIAYNCGLFIGTILSFMCFVACKQQSIVIYAVLVEKDLLVYAICFGISAIGTIGVYGFMKLGAYFAALETGEAILETKEALVDPSKGGPGLVGTTIKVHKFHPDLITPENPVLAYIAEDLLDAGLVKSNTLAIQMAAQIGEGEQLNVDMHSHQLIKKTLGKDFLAMAELPYESYPIHVPNKLVFQHMPGCQYHGMIPSMFDVYRLHLEMGVYRNNWFRPAPNDAGVGVLLINAAQKILFEPEASCLLRASEKMYLLVERRIGSLEDAGVLLKLMALSPNFAEVIDKIPIDEFYNNNLMVDLVAVAAYAMEPHYIFGSTGLQQIEPIVLREMNIHKAMNISLESLCNQYKYLLQLDHLILEGKNMHLIHYNLADSALSAIATELACLDNNGNSALMFKELERLGVLMNSNMD